MQAYDLQDISIHDLQDISNILISQVSIYFKLWLQIASLSKSSHTMNFSCSYKTRDLNALLIWCKFQNAFTDYIQMWLWYVLYLRVSKTIPWNKWQEKRRFADHPFNYTVTLLSTSWVQVYGCLRAQYLPENQSVFKFRLHLDCSTYNASLFLDCC